MRGVDEMKRADLCDDLPGQFYSGIAGQTCPLRPREVGEPLDPLPTVVNHPVEDTPIRVFGFHGKHRQLALLAAVAQVIDDLSLAPDDLRATLCGLEASIRL